MLSEPIKFTFLYFATRSLLQKICEYAAHSIPFMLKLFYQSSLSYLERSAEFLLAPSPPSNLSCCLSSSMEWYLSNSHEWHRPRDCAWSRGHVLLSHNSTTYLFYPGYTYSYRIQIPVAYYLLVKLTVANVLFLFRYAFYIKC